MSRGTVVRAVLAGFLLLSPAVLGQSTVPPKKESPFNLSFGPQKDGGFGAVLKGAKTLSLNTPVPLDRPGQMLSLFGDILLDAGWSSAQDALNNSSFSLRPTIGVQKFYLRTAGDPTSVTTNGPWLFLGVDLRQRFGRFKEGTEIKDINQTIFGATAELRFSPLDPWLQSYSNVSGKKNQVPTLSFTYYQVQDSGKDEATVPASLKVDVIQARFRAALTIADFQCTKETVAPTDPNDPFGGGTKISCPWELSVDLTATKPTQGEDRDLQFLYDVALSYDTGGTFKPVIRYRSGDEHGLEYDEQFLLGLLWEMLPGS